HSETQIAQIAASIRAFGLTNPILIGADDVIIAGHGRLMAAQQLELAEVPVIVLEHLTEAQRRALVIADNKLAENAGWDEELLRLELSALQEDFDFDLDVIGFSDAELEALLVPQPLDLNTDGEDDIPEPPSDPVTRPGDLWLMGNHRLICGDSTVATDVERVLGGIRPLLMVTDPPYGVAYDPAWRNKAGASSTRRTGKVLNDDRADWREAWALFPGDIAYVWHGALHAATVAESLEVNGFAIRSQIVWAKDRLILSRGDYHWQHEPCWYAVKKTGKGHWAGDRKQTTLWRIANKDQDAETVHGTQKPVECMRRPMLNNSSPGQAVYEPFMGSGTTLIAAESCGRICLGVELNPAYVDVAVDRWQRFSGEAIILNHDGHGFNWLRSRKNVLTPLHLVTAAFCPE
ncbi:MAG: site-specific DNA-methyltransferase, partial [Paracoccus sp. (in: a-proteobacteria)]|uniref:site-specific DNA-methyltransferase n=1 Tax=Paracoccus sp. TaxID=267 RepID=UPI0026E0B5EE